MKARTLNRSLRRGRERALATHETPLATALERVFVQTGKEAAQQFKRTANDHLVAAASAPEMAMVTVYPDPEQAVALVQIDGEPAEVLHVTLAFLGEIDMETADRVAEVVAQVATEYGRLKGVVGGIACFGAEPGPATLYPSIALPDVPGLAELRQAVVDALEGNGIEYAQNHGWTPHLTLAYRPTVQPPPENVIGKPLTFDRLTVARGDVPRDFPLGAAVTAAGDKRPPDWTPPHPDEVVDVPNLVKRLRTKSDPVRQAAAKQVMKDPLAQVGIDFDLTNPLVAGVLASTGAKVTDIAETTRLNIMRSIRAAYEEGLSIPDTATLIAEGMADAGAARAREIARTELVGVVNGGSIAAARIVGDVAGVSYMKRWLTAPGAEYPRHEEYEDLDGQTVELDGVFDVGGARLEFPGDPAGPPEEIINCRCAVAIIEPSAAAENADTGDEVALAAAAEVENAPPAALPSAVAPSPGGAVNRAAERTRDRRRAHAQGVVTSKPRAELVRNALVAAGVEEAQSDPISATYDLTRGPVSELAFYRQAEQIGATEFMSESWPTDADALGNGAAFVEDLGCWKLGVFHLGKNAVGFVNLGDGQARICVAGKTKELALDGLSAFHSRYPFAAPPTDDLVPITFWSLSPFGPESRVRRVEVAPWDAIDTNYTAGVREQLAALMSPEFEPGKDGQLHLWHGPPGTGKTWALRALASEWREWAEVHYVTDPDTFFGDNANYMVNVLLRESFDYDVEEGAAPLEKWRVLVLEDTGEMLSADAKQRSGQGLSRLLNVVDGLIGQGLRVLVLVTTNEELEVLHPAVSRPGRCASQVLFASLTAEEASAWLGEQVEEGGTLAELYARGRSEAAADPSDEFALESEAALETIPARRGERLRDSGILILDGEVIPPAVVADATVEAEVPVVEPQVRAGQVRWEGLLVQEGKLTDDGRYIEVGATTWRTLPLSLLAQLETQPGHDGAQVCGRIDEIWRGAPDPTGAVPIFGRGVFDDGEFGSEIARMVGEQVLTGNSVDLAVREFELAYKEDFDENGHRKENTDEGDQEPDLLDAMFGESLVIVFTDAVIGASTVCSFPAFADAEIGLVASGGFMFQARRQAGWIVTVTDGGALPAALEREPVPAAAAVEEPEVITASAAGLVPTVPPAEWFDNPEFEELTALTVDDDGRVYGHLAEWDTCHIGIPGVCTTAPHSMTNYAYFHLGEVEVEGGERISCGKITLGTGHAAKHLGRQAASEHYDHSGAAVADIIVGEDEFGPWVAGALRPDIPAERVRELSASVLSGDWRNVNGNLELVAILAVNVPGFPVPRVRAEIVASGEEAHVTALTAAGIVLHDEDLRPKLSDADRATLAVLGARAAGLDALVALAQAE